jgi:hypothetical protein
MRAASVCFIVRGRIAWETRMTANQTAKLYRGMHAAKGAALVVPPRARRSAFSPSISSTTPTAAGSCGIAADSFFSTRAIPSTFTFEVNS